MEAEEALGILPKTRDNYKVIKHHNDIPFQRVSSPKRELGSRGGNSRYTIVGRAADSGSGLPLLHSQPSQKLMAEHSSSSYYFS